MSEVKSATERRYQYRKVNGLKTTEAELETLKAQGWEFVGQLQDKTDREGKVVVVKSHWLRFRRPDLGKPTPGTPYLKPDKVVQKLGLLYGAEIADARARGAKLASDTRKAD